MALNDMFDMKDNVHVRVTALNSTPVICYPTDTFA
jgi:hypothetical protein